MITSPTPTAALTAVQQAILSAQATPPLGAILTRNIAYNGAAAVVGNATGVLSSHPDVGAAIDTQGVTLCIRMVLADAFDAIQIGFPNWHTAAVTGVKIAVKTPTVLSAILYGTPADNALNFTTAQNPQENTVWQDGSNTPVPVTFGNGAVLPQNQTFPPQRGTFTPSITLSDWLPISGADRTDGGAGQMVDVLVYYPAGTYASLNTGTHVAQLGRADKWTSGRAIRTWLQAGDWTGSGNVSTHVCWYTTVPLIVNYRARTAGAKQVLLSGDSIYEGTGNQFLNYTATTRSVYALSTPAAPIEVAVATKISADVPSLKRMADEVLQLCRPHVHVFAVGTPNSGISTINVNRLMGAHMQALRAKNPLGKVLGLGFAPYAGGYNAATDALRIANNTAAGAYLTGNGHFYLDTDPSVAFSLTESPRKLSSDPSHGNTGDGTHWAESEQTALTTALQPVLAAALAASAG